jgi:uncharacterized SAM-binding protein YcdF (DUF218 family)
MFLFFSKLIPLFFYPLGLTCLLLLVALGLLALRRLRWAVGAIALAVVVLWTAANGWVAVALARSLESQSLVLQAKTGGSATELPTADAIVVLGGGIKSTEPPRPWIDLADEGDRTIYGVKLYRDRKAPKLIFSGGRIEWRGGGSKSEAAEMAELAGAMGVPNEDMLRDDTSLNTRENAVNVKAIMDRERISRILLVTSAMHMPRSLAIFQKLGIQAIAAPTDFLFSDRDAAERQSSIQAIALNLLPDADNLRVTTRAIKEYVGMLAYWLRGWL